MLGVFSYLISLILFSLVDDDVMVAGIPSYLHARQGTSRAGASCRTSTQELDKNNLSTPLLHGPTCSTDRDYDWKESNSAEVTSFLLL